MGVNVRLVGLGWQNRSKMIMFSAKILLIFQYISLLLKCFLCLEISITTSVKKIEL